MLRMTRELYDELTAHARTAYPRECCGVLVGTASEVKVVERVVRTENRNTERAGDRYEISPADLNRIDKEARAEGLDVLGFYHSHPDHADRPSRFDRERGQPWYSYLIVSVRGGRVESARSWCFEEPDEPFAEEALEIA
ncbi:MAG TPA: M67 family peptidase [Deltaproteobacteria bacterium]|nr:M67 family peptidase [Deltaproteobacteria bacterium]